LGKNKGIHIKVEGTIIQCVGSVQGTQEEQQESLYELWKFPQPKKLKSHVGCCWHFYKQRNLIGGAKMNSHVYYVWFSSITRSLGLLSLNFIVEFEKKKPKPNLGK